jgi:tetratricopeptide (TPR) repeat protein
MYDTQIANAIEHWTEALQSLNCAIRLNPSKLSSYQMRGNVFVKLRYFQRAYKDLKFVLSESKEGDLDSRSYVVYILLAKCENQFGNVARGIRYLHTGLADSSEQLTPSHKTDLYMELVINYLTISDVKNVVKYLNKIFAIDPTHLLAHGYSGLFHQNKGEAAKSILSYQKVLQGNPKEIQSLHFIGLGHFAQGHYEEAIAWFDRLLAVDPSHYAWCLKEMAWYRWTRLDTPLDRYNADADLHWLLKDAWIRRSPQADYCKSRVCHKNLKLVTAGEVKALKGSGSSLAVSMEDFYSSEETAQFLRVVNMTKSISSWIQVDSPGFLVHKR